MGKIFTLGDDVKSIIQDALDDILTELSKECRLVYKSKMNLCVNCVFDPAGKKSSNRWKTGGPMLFSTGTACPMCNGAGYRADEVSELINLLCEWEVKKFVTPFKDIDIKVPFAIVQTKGYLTDLPKILRCDHIIMQVPIEGILRGKYRLRGEPGDRSNIIQNRYFVAVWERFE